MFFGNISYAALQKTIPKSQRSRVDAHRLACLWGGWTVPSCGLADGASATSAWMRQPFLHGISKSTISKKMNAFDTNQSVGISIDLEYQCRWLVVFPKKSKRIDLVALAASHSCRSNMLDWQFGEAEVVEKSPRSAWPIMNGFGPFRSKNLRLRQFGRPVVKYSLSNIFSDWNHKTRNLLAIQTPSWSEHENKNGLRCTSLSGNSWIKSDNACLDQGAAAQSSMVGWARRLQKQWNLENWPLVNIRPCLISQTCQLNHLCKLNWVSHGFTSARALRQRAVKNAAIGTANEPSDTKAP